MDLGPTCPGCGEPWLRPTQLPGRYRSGDDDELVQRGILLTMSGLATALRNSG